MTWSLSLVFSSLWYVRSYDFLCMYPACIRGLMPVISGKFVAVISLKIASVHFLSLSGTSIACILEGCTLSHIFSVFPVFSFYLSCFSAQSFGHCFWGGKCLKEYNDVMCDSFIWAFLLSEIFHSQVLTVLIASTTFKQITFLFSFSDIFSCSWQEGWYEASYFVIAWSRISTVLIHQVFIIFQV